MAVKVSVYGTADMRQIANARKELDELERKARGSASGFAGSMGRLGGSITGVGQSMAGLGDTMSTKVTVPLLAVGAGLAMATKAAADDEAAAAQLARTLTNVTGATKDQITATEDWISKQTLATGIADDQIRPALGRLASSTKDIGEAQKLAALAMEISTAKGIPLETVANALAKANDGQFASLKKLGVSLGSQTQAAAEAVKINKALEKAQMDATRAMTEHGPQSDEYKRALAKVKDEQSKLNAVTADGTDWMGELGKQFGGSLAANADTAAGQMARTKVAFQEATEQLGYSFIPIMKQGAELLQTTVVPAINKMVDWFSKLSPGTKNAVLGMGVFVAAVGPVLSITGRMVQGIGALVSGIGKFAGAIPKAISAAMGLGRAVISGAAAVGRMTLALLRNGVQMGIAAARWIAATAASIAHRAATLAGVIVQGAATAAQWLWNAALAANPIGLIVIAIAALVGALIYAWNNSETFRNIVLGAWGAIKSATVVVFGAIKKAIGVVWEWIKTAFRLTPVGLIITHWDKIKAATILIFNGVKKAIGVVWEWIKTTFRLTPVGLIITHWDTLKARTIGAFRAVKEAIQGGIDKVRALASAVGAKVGEVVGFFLSIRDRVSAVFRNAASWLVDAGKNIVNGLWSGIQSMWDTLLANIRGAINLLPEAVKKFLGISSPSRVFAAIGRDIAGGMQQGVEQGTNGVLSAVRTMAAGASGSATLNVASNAPVLVGAGIGASTRNVTVAPGAVQVTVDGGDAAGVQAAIDRAFQQLVRELRAA